MGDSLSHLDDLLVPQYGHKKTMLPWQRTGPILIFLDNSPCLQPGKYINRLRRLSRF